MVEVVNGGVITGAEIGADGSVRGGVHRTREQSLVAEIERLRAALTEISALLPDTKDRLDNGNSLAWNMVRIARRAFEQQELGKER